MQHVLSTSLLPITQGSHVSLSTTHLLQFRIVPRAMTLRTNLIHRVASLHVTSFTTIQHRLRVTLTRHLVLIIVSYLRRLNRFNLHNVSRLSHLLQLVFRPSTRNSRHFSYVIPSRTQGQVLTVTRRLCIRSVSLYKLARTMRNIFQSSTQ